MTDWYKDLLDGRVIASGDDYAFISHDGEHHRIALIGVAGQPAEYEAIKVGFYHQAFQLSSLADLLAANDRLTALGIVPYRIANHIVTFSMYFLDPDRNAVEFYVDLFESTAAAIDYMNGAEFSRNPAGYPYDLDLLRTRLAANPDEALIKKGLRG